MASGVWEMAQLRGTWSAAGFPCHVIGESSLYPVPPKHLLWERMGNSMRLAGYLGKRRHDYSNHAVGVLRTVVVTPT